MSTWDAANRIEELSYKAHNIKCVLEIIAELTKEESASGALWGACDMLEQISNQLQYEAKLQIELYKFQKAKKK